MQIGSLPHRWARRGALALVFFVKLAVVLQLTHHPLLQADAGLDTTIYLELARQVLGGNPFLGPGLYFVSPLYIYFSAAVLAAADSLTAVRVVQVALGTAAVMFVFVAAREWFGERAAWCAGALGAFTGLFTFYETLILQAALDPFLTAAALAGLAVALNRGGTSPFLVAGIVFGIQTLNRPNVMIPVGAIVLALLVIRRWRSAALLAAGVLITLTPVAVRNVAVAGEWTPLASHGGLNFYIGNNPEADGTYGSVPGITPNLAGQQEDARRIAEQATGRVLNDTEVSTYFYRLGLSWIASDPAAAVRLFLRKLQYTLSASHLWLNYSYPFFAFDERTLLAVLIIGPWILVPLGLTGLLAAAPIERRASYLVWAMFVPAYAISVAIFFASERYRLPLLVPMCIGAGGLLSQMAGVYRARDARRGAVLLSAVASLVVFVNWPLGLDDGRREQRVRMVERLVARAQYEEAARRTERALTQHAAPGLVHFRVGRALLARGRADAALPHLQAAARIDPEHAETSFALGQALLDAGRTTEAVPHLRRAVEAGVRPDVSGYDLVRALAASGDSAAALRVLQDVQPARQDDAKSWYALGQIAEQLGSPEVAASRYGRAAQAAPRWSQAWERYGLMLALMGRFEEAAASLEQAVTADPGYASARLNLAAAYARLGRVDEARAQAREALRLDPSYQKAKDLLQALSK